MTTHKDAHIELAEATKEPFEPSQLQFTCVFCLLLVIKDWSGKDSKCMYIIIYIYI